MELFSRRYPLFCVVEKVLLPEEPPLDEICKDKFLIQLVTVTPEREDLSINDVVGTPPFLVFVLFIN